MLSTRLENIYIYLIARQTKNIVSDKKIPSQVLFALKCTYIHDRTNFHQKTSYQIFDVCVVFVLLERKIRKSHPGLICHLFTLYVVRKYDTGSDSYVISVWKFRITNVEQGSSLLCESHDAKQKKQTTCDHLRSRGLKDLLASGRNTFVI